MLFKIPTTILLVILSATMFAQDENPFQSVGKKGKILTISNGKYEELFDQSDIQQIGTALINIRTMKVVKLFRNEKEAEKLLDNSTNTRFLSVDPMAHTFPMLTPYQYASNCPISGVDLDGLEFYFAANGNFLGQNKNGGSQIRIATEYHTYTATSTNGGTGHGYVFTRYKDIDKVDPSIASKVYETIFQREVGGYLKSITVMNATDRPTLGAQTQGKGEFGINSANVENGERLNNDYFNAAATLYHEKQHSDKRPAESSDGFSHFNIERTVVDKSGLYDQTSANFKGYVKQLFDQYLGDQEVNLREIISNAHSDNTQVYSANHYLQEYKKNYYCPTKVGLKLPISLC